MLIRNDSLLIDTPIEWISIFIDSITSEDLEIIHSGVDYKNITSISLDCPMIAQGNGAVCAINWAINREVMTFESNDWEGYHGYIGIPNIMGVVGKRMGVSRICFLFPVSNIYYSDSKEVELVKTFLDAWKM